MRGSRSASSPTTSRVTSGAPSPTTKISVFPAVCASALSNGERIIGPWSNVGIRIVASIVVIGSILSRTTIPRMARMTKKELATWGQQVARLEKAGRIDEALAEARALAKQGAGSAETQCLLGGLYLRLG